MARERKARLTVALQVALVMVGLAALVMLTTTDALRICDENVTDAGERVELCRRATLTDPIAILWFGLALAGLWPWLSKVSIFGLSLERRVREAEGAIDRVSSAVQTLRLESAASASASTQLNFILDRDTFLDRDSLSLQVAKDRVDAVGEAEGATEDTSEVIKTGAASSDRSPAELRLAKELTSDSLRVQLLAEWEHLRLLAYDDPTGLHPTEPLSQSGLRSEVELVRRVRNSVAHSKALPDGAVEEAVAVAQQVSDVLLRLTMGKDTAGGRYERSVISTLPAALPMANVVLSADLDSKVVTDAIIHLPDERIAVEVRYNPTPAIIARASEYLARVVAVGEADRGVIIANTLPSQLERDLPGRTALVFWPEGEVPDLLARRVLSTKHGQ